MPKGDNPNSRKNLKPPSAYTPEELRARNAKAGRASGVAKRRAKSFREIDAETTTDEEKAAMWAMLKKMAAKGNMKAFELYRDTIGEKPETAVNVQGSVANPLAGLTEEELRKLANSGGE